MYFAPQTFKTRATGMWQRPRILHYALFNLKTATTLLF